VLEGIVVVDKLVVDSSDSVFVVSVYVVVGSVLVVLVVCVLELSSGLLLLLFDSGIGI
ncbi:16114_t:CDS:2, partial [Gigaspora margarita]